MPKYKQYSSFIVVDNAKKVLTVHKRNFKMNMR